MAMQAREDGRYPPTNSERLRGLGLPDEMDPMRALPAWGDGSPGNQHRPFHLRALERAQECEARDRAAWEARGRPLAYTTAGGIQVERRA